MNQEKCSAMEEYLNSQFPGSQIEQANISDSQHYRISTDNGLLMLKVGSEFIEDNSQEEIIKKLQHWGVPELLQENSTLGILVTDSGASPYDRT